jgi:hypothetical protein
MESEMLQQAVEKLLTNVRELPIYKNAVRDVCEQVAELEFVPFWTRDEFQGLRFAPATVPPHQMSMHSVWASPKDKTCTLDSMGSTILYRAAYDVWKKRIEDYFVHEKLLDDHHTSRLYFSVALHKIFGKDCLEQSKARQIAQELMDQSKRALEDGTVLRHNRRVHTDKILQPIRDALWGGLTVEDITKIAQAVKDQIPKERPSFEEVLNTVFGPEKKS